MQKTEKITARDAEHLGPLLGFKPAVQAHFEAETGADRVSHLRRAILIGLLFYNTYNVTNLVLMPDAIALGIGLRLGVVTPIGLLLIWFVGVASPRSREVGVQFGSLGGIAVPYFLLWYSAAPNAVYTIAEAPLAMAFVMLMLVPRFVHALVFTLLAVLMGVTSFALKPSNTTVLAATLSLQTVSAACFLLYGNYRLEAAVRRSYLKALSARLQNDVLEQNNEALERLTHTDPLTGVGNRRAFAERMELWSSASALGQPAVGLLMVDVDLFKRYNDHYGHPAGDACLQRLAVAMRACLRDDRDLLARYGGEEFAAVLPGTDAASLAAAAERLCNAVSALRMPHPNRGDDAGIVTVSVGVALAQPGSRPLEHELVAAADAALYEAKRRGRDRYVMADPILPGADRRLQPARLA